MRSIRVSFVRVWPSSNADRIYHYTNVRGLLGIINTKKANELAGKLLGQPPLPGGFSLWFTDALYLNDPQELRLGGPMLAQYVKREIETQGAPADYFAEVLDWLESDNITADGLSGKWSGAYVASFSRDADSLSQWRDYADVRGYAIGINVKALEDMTPPLTQAESEFGQPVHLGLPGLTTPMVCEVEYDEDGWRRVCEQMASLIVESDPDQRTYMCQAALAQIKQSAYSMENEVRAFVVRGQLPIETEFRSGPLGVVPYINVSYLPRESHDHPFIHEVWVGPGHDIELRQAAVKQLLDSVGFGAVPVRASEIHFRG